MIPGNGNHTTTTQFTTTPENDPAIALDTALNAGVNLAANLSVNSVLAVLSRPVTPAFSAIPDLPVPNEPVGQTFDQYPGITPGTTLAR